MEIYVFDGDKLLGFQAISLGNTLKVQQIVDVIECGCSSHGHLSEDYSMR